MTTTITVTTDQWKKQEDNYFYTHVFVNEVLENKPLIQVYQKTNDVPMTYNMLIPYILRVEEIPQAERGFFIHIWLGYAIDGHIAIR
jgi:hypothetical protein